MTVGKKTNLYSVFHIAKIVLQTKTPLSIASGKDDLIHDNLLVRDANGLPSIPGTSLAGVLRHLYTQLTDIDQAEALFGCAKSKEKKEESPSLVQVSWGYLHDADDNPVEDLLQPGDTKFKNDGVLRDARQSIPVKRDHVRINDKGVARKGKRSKFDKVSLTAGHRFSVELSLWSDQNPDPRWDSLLNILKQPAFRLGSSTRRGLGKMELVRCYSNVFELSKTSSSDYEKFQEISPSLADYTSLKKQEEIKTDHEKTFKLDLAPEKGGFRFGGGIEPLSQNNAKHPPDLVPVTERMIEWDENNTGSLGRRKLLIPASGIKGALRHRSAYYYNLLTGENTHVDNNTAVSRLFGHVDEDENEARPGLVIIDDQYLDIDHIFSMQLEHTSIDRFTGGVREHMLFSEELVGNQKPMELTICLLEDKKRIDQDDPAIYKSFELALKDLQEGRLAIGAGSGRIGSGFFREPSNLQNSQNNKKKEVNNEVC